MEIVTSVLSIVKGVKETEREFRILKDKLVFHIKKAETALLKYSNEQHIHSFILINLEGRLKDANERLEALQNLLSSDKNDSQGLSLYFFSHLAQINSSCPSLSITKEIKSHKPSNNFDKLHRNSSTIN